MQSDEHIPGKRFVPWRGYLAYGLVFVQLTIAVTLIPATWPWWLAGLYWLVVAPVSFLTANLVCRPYQPVEQWNEDQL